MHHNKAREKKRIDHLLFITFTQTNEICSSLDAYIDKCHIRIYIQRQKPKLLLYLFRLVAQINRVNRQIVKWPCYADYELNIYR
jgi:hypothetical protein